MTLRLSPMRWLVTLVGVQLLAGVLWALGPLLPPLEPWAVRLALLLALLLVWAGANLGLDVLAQRRDAALARGVAGDASALGARLAAALAAMRRLKGRRPLYEQPWYAIIGPPGAGKTTALLNAGLTFLPTGQTPGEGGAGAVAGVGGTRLCDWWFTADAVLIDTAGRYTTQDSDRAADGAGWAAFLDLLRRTRPRRPLNGVIVALALPDVADAAGQGAAHARAVRARLDELEARLRVRLPVYVLFTKADLLAGFTEFFDDLDRAGRRQIWGATAALDARAPLDAVEALRPLLARLDRRMFARLDAEPRLDRRALIAGFPAQFASVLPAVQAFVAAAFGPGAGGTAPFLRGLYLASGTQEGTPIDRLVGGLSRAFGLGSRRMAAMREQGRAEAGRSFFLTDLLRDVVFREALLVGHRPGAAQRRRVLRAAGFAACAVAVAAGLGTIWAERAAHAGAVTAAELALADRAKLAEALPLDPVAEADMTQLLPWLDTLAAGVVRPAGGRDWLGYSQEGKLAAAGAAHYRHALGFALLPRLVWRTEMVMRGLLGQPDALYDVTRVNLMLGGAGPLDRVLVQDWFVRDWEATLPGAAQAPVRAGLGRHLAALLDGPLPAIPLDGPLVAAARQAIGRVPLAQRAYSRLKPLAAAQGVRPWRPADALGPLGVPLFLRLSGKGLEEGVPGLFTREGLQRAVLPALPEAARQAADEGWVLGDVSAPDPARLRTLQADILALYAAEDVAVWDAMLADLNPVPLRNLGRAAQDLYILATPRSPMRALLASVAAELAPADLAPVDLAPAGQIPAGAGGADRTALAAVEERFRPLRALFGSGGAVPIDQVLRPLSDLEQQLARQTATTTKPQVAVGEDPAAALRAEAARQPQPLSRWLLALATGGAALRDGGPRGAMIAAWNAGGGPAALCPAVIGNRYPFVAGAVDDAPLADFTRLFAPGGAIDAFFNAQLRPYVDMESKPWRLKPVDGVTAPLTPGDLGRFQQAAAIRDLFFPAGSAQPLVRFDVVPPAAAPGAAAATLELGGVTVALARDAAPRPVSLTWPGRVRDAVARLTPPGQPAVEAGGPWAPFRLLAGAKSTTAGDRQSFVFGPPDHAVRLDVRASPNPFASPVLGEFRCPVVQ